MRRLVLAAAAFALLAVAGPAASPCRAAEEDRAPHPHFNDGGTLSWYRKLADAQREAKKAGKLIFIEFGREA